VKEYPNIGAFYSAVAYGAGQLTAHVRGGVNQVDLFSAFYRNMPSLQVTDSGPVGFRQVDLLIQVITGQGEGSSRTADDVVYAFQNTATDKAPQLSHFEKFIDVRRSLPATYPMKTPSEWEDGDRECLAILREHFAGLLDALRQLFAGRNPPEFLRLMVTVGADIHNCWKHGVAPRFD
jgi:hypothetical protein